MMAAETQDVEWKVSQTGVNLVTGHRSFAACAYDLSMKEHFENALKEVLRNGPLYKRVGNASYCLIFLKESDFPPELEADVAILFSIFTHVRHLGKYGEYRDYSHIPLCLQRQWIAALLRVYRLLMIAKGAASVLPIADAAGIDEACREHVSAFF
jgi:hypothetical protein